MSEFKVGDWVKRTDKRTESIYQITSIQEGLIKCTFKKNGEDWRLHTTKGEIEHATPEEIAAGHRIDEVVPVYADVKFPYKVLTGEQVGAVMNATHYSYDLGDDFPIENHISPNCKVSEAHINEADKLNRLG